MAVREPVTARSIDAKLGIRTVPARGGKANIKNALEWLDHYSPYVIGIYQNVEQVVKGPM
jgi:hypothetical protein